MLRFIESRTADDDSGYSVWEDSHGAQHYIADRHYGVVPTWWHASREAWRRMDPMPVDELTIDQAIHAANEDGLTLEQTRALVIEGEHDNLIECGYLRHPGNVVSDGTDSHTVDEETWCDACFDVALEQGTIHNCYHCEDWFSEGMTPTEEGHDYCEGCSDRHTFWCEICEVHSEQSHDHDHDESDESTYCCEAPMQEFTLPVYEGAALYDTLVSEQSDTGPAVAQPLIYSDSMYDVSVLGNYLRDDSYSVIYTMLNDILLSDYPLPIDESPLNWQGVPARMNHALNRVVMQAFRGVDRTYKPEGQAVYAKRLRSAIYNATKESFGADGAVGLTPAQMSDIGTIARKGSDPLELQIAVTRDLNQSRSEFGNASSCWWSDYSHSRCTLKSNGGFGIRSFGYNAYGNRRVTGRAWVLPCKVDLNGVVRPTFGTPEAYVVFNGYGDLEEETGAQALAHVLGLSATMRTYIFPPHRMYVNGETARIVATAETLKRRLTIASGLEQHATFVEPEEADISHEVLLASQRELREESERLRAEQKAEHNVQEGDRVRITAVNHDGTDLIGLTGALTSIEPGGNLRLVGSEFLPNMYVVDVEQRGGVGYVASGVEAASSAEQRAERVAEQIADIGDHMALVGDQVRTTTAVMTEAIDRLTVTRLDGEGNPVGEVFNIPEGLTEINFPGTIDILSPPPRRDLGYIDHKTAVWVRQRD